MKTRITDAKISVLDMHLQKERMKMGVNVVIDDPAQLERIRERESGIVIEPVEMILKAGANVIFMTKGLKRTTGHRSLCRRPPHNPTTLAVNAAKDSFELVSQLRSRHALSQRTSDPVPSKPHKSPSTNGHPSPTKNSGASSSQQNIDTPDAKALGKAKGYRNYGLDLSKGRVHDCVKAGVFEPSMSKVKELKSAVEACVAIMRIDTLIKLDPEQRGGEGEDDRHGH
ncbi:chaperonin-containing T-complex alpha subunit Cct1 [Elasticomyces elasticus]|nr:chaperonin-containing T-complex alpha subunit Cct1 [Elasticomyces elasticus]